MTDHEKNDDIEQILATDLSSRRKRRLKIWTIVLLASILFIVYLYSRQTRKTVRYRFQQVRKGDLTITVTATGNLEATNKVDVGVEVSGTIEKIYADFNDQVKKGEILASLDLSKFTALMLKAKATLELARADVLKAKAKVKQTRSKLSQVQRAYKLSKGKVPSQAEIDIAEANFKIAKAELDSARSRVSEAKANLAFRETDLSKAVIHSPINGIVLARHVEEGQTVAASLRTPVLFTLAEDLREMELHVDVDEADVGQVKEGQQATFTVDAYPDRNFPAKVTEVRFSPKTIEGVVTYETLLDVDNSDMSLRPGMTATADIVVNHIKDALLVPNAALRFVPPKKESSEKEQGLLNAILPHHPKGNKKQRGPAVQGQQRTVWILRNGRPKPVSITVGKTDGNMSQVVAGDIRPGMQLLTDIIIDQK